MSCLVLLSFLNPVLGQTNGLLREVYSGIPGTSVADLTNNAAFPNNPTSTNFITDYFEAPINVGDNYGQRLRGFITAPQTGSYIFWIASDDGSVLFVSTNESPANKLALASVPGYTSSRQWNKFPAQQSSPISLIAGQHYYIEALMKENTGNDNLAVRWQLPDTTIEEPIPASRLIPGGSPVTPPIITQSPTNITVVEGQPASFSVGVSNFDSVRYQWKRGVTNIPSANGPSYTIPIVALTDNGAQFSCFITNTLGNTNSTSATLFVTPDTNAPALIYAVNLGSTNVEVIFSEPVSIASATTITNYSLNNGATITAATFGSDTRTVLLTTSPLMFGSNYMLTVSNVKDRAATPNTIAANSTYGFLCSEFVPQDVGDPTLGGSQIRLTNGFAITGGGCDIGGTADQLQFSYQFRTGNFDVKARVESLSLADVWTKAGLVAREDLSDGSRFAGAMATPGLSGCFFESRDPAGSTATVTGSFPVNYPSMWLRLQRVGNLFTGYASYDGQIWTQLGTATVAMPSTVYFGLAVSSHNPSQSATAQFRDIADVSGAVVASLPVDFEPLGPSSRKTGLVISEIMYKPAPRVDGKNLEFIELFNSNPYYEDISGYRISGEVDYTFPTNTILPGGGFLVIAKDPAAIQSVYGIANVVGPYANSLGNSGTIRLRSKIDAIYLEVPYDHKSPWPIAADGVGHSLVLARPSYGEAEPHAWDISDKVGGSPGGYDSYSPSPLRSVVINEFLAHTDPPLLDYVELYNHANAPVDISGCIITDDPTTNRFIVPPSTVIPARGFISFTETALGFRLDATGESIYFKNTNDTRVLDAIEFEGQENSVSMGRYPDGASEFYPMQTRTPSAANSVILLRDVVINEIMYNPISRNDDDQYVELYNKGNSTVNLGGWRFVSGINFTFPTNQMLAPNSYLVVAANVTNLLAHYGNLNVSNTVGNFGGKLSHTGERLALAKWDEVVNTNTPGVTETNIAWIVVDEVTYGEGGRWGKWADGGGSSLELIDPHSNHRLAYNWADSDETAKAPWTTIEATGVLDNGSSYNNGSISFVQLGLLAEGECLVDDIEVLPNGSGGNIASNPGFESGTTGWVVQGDHIRSTVESVGAYSGTQCLHIRASDGIWTGDNSTQCALTSTTLAANQTVTLRFKARWLRGWPEALLRLAGNWFEATGRLSVPQNLGTPGAANSRKVSNAGPAIYEVTHFPSIPSASQNVVVSARVHDLDGLSSIQLKWRLDPASTYTTTAMVDNGTGGDAVAGDGIYSATVPGQTAGTVVAFYVHATDALAAVTRFPADLANGTPLRECVIYFDDTIPVSSFGSYHLWLTQTNIDRWSSLQPLSNEPIDATWVYGNRIIYNMTATFTGSPYHQTYNSPIGNPCSYSCEMPADDKFFGTTKVKKIHAPGNAPLDDDTIQREQLAYWMLRQIDLPWNYRRYVSMYVNGNRRGTFMEDTQVPNSDVIDEDFSDDPDGQLFKLQPWFEFATNGTSFNNKSWCTLLNYTTTGGAKKVARYRWSYMARSADYSMNDYTNMFALIDAANSYNSPNFVANLEALADMDEWMRTFAAGHSFGDWDIFTYQSSQNTYAYKPPDGRWTLLLWDCNIVFGSSSSHGPGPGNLFQTSDSTAAQIYANPTFRRSYLRTFKEIANGPMSNAAADPILDAKFNAITADGVTVAAPTSVKSWIAIMHNSLLTTLTNEGANAPFAITSNGGNDFSTNNNYINITGTAPVDIKSILINGIEWPVTWNSVTGWAAAVVLNPGTNVLNIQGMDRNGGLVAGGSASISVNYTGSVESPQDRLVINEIMYNAALPDAGFVEIYNSSTNYAFDLSGWRLDGADFTFPGSSIILPGSYLIVAGDAQGFIKAYGNGIPLAGTYNGTLQNNGETLKLVRPGTNDIVIDEVTYDSAPPWPTSANGFGPSLQLIDSAQDNNRVANWAAVTQSVGTNSQSLLVVTNVWKYNQSGIDLGTTWRNPSYNDASWSSGLGLLYVEDSALPAPKNTALTLGATTYYFRTHFNFSGNPANAVLTLNTVLDDGAVVYLNGVEVFRIGMGTGTPSYSTYASRTVGNAVYEGPFTIPATSLVAGDNVIAVEVHQVAFDSSDIVLGLTLSSTSVSGGPYTPGAVNSVKATLPQMPQVWLNEVQPNNLTGLQDNYGERDPWVELYNSGTNAVDLSNYYLSDNYSNLTRWPFPASTMINPGQFRVVWLDNQTGQNSGTNLHANFRASSTNGAVVLVKVSGGVTNIVDYLNYKPLNNDRSYGAFADGTPAKRRTFYYATPGATNNNSWPNTLVTVNEWMADNTHTLSDPADGHFDDWFELHNAGNTPADLSGYTLTDDLSNTNKFTIPSGYVVPANGFLLVWADNDSNQNKTNDPNLHVNFALSKGGEAIGLYTPTGVPVDTITFGQQTNDVSQGRWPDGNSGSFYFMTTPTPLAANVLGDITNHAPVLDFISDQVVYQGSPLGFTVTSSDPDSGQTKTYTLDVGAPATAYINPNSGIFSWTPSDADVPGDHYITVCVTDDGTPPLDDSQSVKLTVLSPPTLQFTTIVPNGDGTLTFHWATQPDRDYRILYKNDLGEIDWTPLTDMPSGGTNLSLTIGITNDLQRFFQIELLP